MTSMPRSWLRMLRDILVSCLDVFRAIDIPTSESDIRQMVHAALYVGPGAVLDFARPVYETRLSEIADVVPMLSLATV
jgi:hypothetical protein